MSIKHFISIFGKQCFLRSCSTTWAVRIKLPNEITECNLHRNVERNVDTNFFSRACFNFLSLSDDFFWVLGSLDFPECGRFDYISLHIFKVTIPHCFIGLRYFQSILFYIHMAKKALAPNTLVAWKLFERKKKKRNSKCTKLWTAKFCCC